MPAFDNFLRMNGIGDYLDPTNMWVSDLFDISAAASEQVFYFQQAATIHRAWIVWNEATEASGPAEGDITLGTTTGGAELVAATAYAASKATGSIQNLTLLLGGKVAGSSAIFASHDQAASATGTYFLCVEYTYDSVVA